MWPSPSGNGHLPRRRRETMVGRHISTGATEDLKLGKLTHQDLGQMQMYVNYFDRYQRQEHETPTVGIVLCSDKNDAMVKITLPDDQQQIHASRYQLYLPTEEELREELEREREEAEQAFRLMAPQKRNNGPDS